MHFDVDGLISGLAKGLTKAACDDPPQAFSAITLGDPKAERRSRLFTLFLRRAIGAVLIGILGFAIWFGWVFSR
jgi:hypothetical protein